MIDILVTGDFCPINKTEEMVLQGNYYGLFNDFSQLIKKSDLAITNLECPLTNYNVAISKFGLALRAVPETVKLIKNGGFNLVTLANNHIMDFGAKGLMSTIELLKENEISFVGAGASLLTAKIPFTTKLKGKNIAVINLTENEFSTTHGDYPGANPLSLIVNYTDIQNAKSSNDIVIVIYHGGNEEYNLPSPRLKEVFRFFVEAGADAVIAHHTHRYSGFETYKNSLIFYGIGNFLFDHEQNTGNEWQYGIAISLNFHKKNISFEIHPISQFDTNTSGVRLLNGDQKKHVLNKIEELNKIIENDEELHKKFNEFIKLKEKQYQHFIEPHTVRVLHSLMSHGFLPSMLSKKKRKLYLNLIRCESHRDILIEILQNENRHT